MGNSLSKTLIMYSPGDGGICFLCRRRWRSEKVERWVGGSAQRFESRAKLNDAVSAPEAAHNPFSSSPYASKADFAK